MAQAESTLIKAVKKQKGLSILLSLAIVILIVILASGQKAPMENSAALNMPSSVSSSSKKKDITRWKRVRKEKEMPEAVKTLMSKVGREDPFHKPTRGIAPEPLRIRSGMMVLEGIIWDGQKALAIIGDQIVGEGDFIGAMEIIRIEEGHVVYVEQGRHGTLILGESGKDEGRSQ